MFRFILVILAALALSTPADGATRNPSIPTRPCPTEDSMNCVWDARHMGNGEGASFLAFANGHRVFVSHARAHRLIHGRAA